MKRITAFILLMLLVKFSGAQEPKTAIEGVVSFISSQYVYVKFASTSGITKEDTLYIRQGNALKGILLVKELSSTSCMCIPVSQYKPNISDKIIAQTGISEKQEVKPGDTDTTGKTSPPLVSEKITAPAKTAERDSVKSKQEIKGKITLASYSNVSNTPLGNSQRMRYTFSLNAKNIGESGISAESYISFIQRDKSWEGSNNILKGLKIYNLSVNIPVTAHSKIWAGRKINSRISNVGAIDGVQYEIKSGSLTAGLFSGFRPDLSDYGFNGKLLQMGGYLSHDYNKDKRFIQSTLAFVELQNAGSTDRRFAYLQHSNTLVKNVYFFGSMEIDLFRQKADSINNELIFSQENKPKLTNIYLSLRYRVNQKLSTSLSYSSVNNIIYYETYKNYIERLLENPRLQGYLMQFNYQLFKKVSVGLTAGYRFYDDDPDPEGDVYGKPSKSIYSHITYSMIPHVNLSTTLSSTILETSYLSGKIYSIGIVKDLIKGRLFAGLNYRYVDYFYFFSESDQQHHMAEADIAWKIARKFTATLYAENTFERNNQYNQIYISLSKSF